MNRVLLPANSRYGLRLRSGGTRNSSYPLTDETDTSTPAHETPRTQLFRELYLPAVLSLVFWYIVPLLGGAGQLALLALFGVSAVYVGFSLLSGKPVTGLICLAYLAAIQPPLRMYAPALPFLMLNYLLVLYGAIVLFRAGRNIHITLPLLFYGLYTLLEIAGTGSSYSQVYARTILLPSLTVFVFVLMAAQIELSGTDLRRILVAYIVGAAGLIGLVARNYLTGNVKWGTASNFDASANMGPNQLAFLLCVAAFCCLLVGNGVQKQVRIAYWVMAGLCSYFMILTFSRGGGYILAGVVLLYYLVLRRPSMKTVASMFGTFVFGGLVFLMATNTSQGKIAERYSRTDTSNRDVLVEKGWQMFLDNPVWGVGTSNFHVEVERMDFVTSGAHNELVRAASEHGIIGLTCWLLFVITCFMQAFRGKGSQNRNTRALRAAFLIMATVSMFHNGLKLLVQPLLFFIGLSAFSGDMTGMSSTIKASVGWPSFERPQLARRGAKRNFESARGKHRV